MIGCYVSGVVIETLNVASDSLDPSRLPDDVPLLREVIGQLLESLKQTQGRADRLEHRLGQLLRARFGPRSEKLDVAQLTLFAAELIGQSPTESTGQEGHVDELKSLGRANPTRGGHGRQRLPKDLPRRRVEHELAGDALACPCCGDDRVRIGQEVSEQLEYVPASVYVLEHVRGKYACRRCEGEVVVADKPTQPIEKGLAGPGLLAATIVNKYSDHLPLYRQEKIFKRHGVKISRSTTCGWMRDCAALVKPLVDLMSRRVKQSKVIHTDDTPVPVQDPSRDKTRTGRFWVYVGDKDHPYTVYDYTPTRSRDGPLRWLGGFQGYLQADAYSGYDVLYRDGDVVEVGCWAHSRRYFFDARLSDPARSHTAMARISRLYDVERQAKSLDATDRVVLRQQQSVVLLEQLRSWLDDQHVEVLPKSPMGQAIGYALSNWQALTRYTQDGDLSIDNNVSERALRPVAIGRKNWLFAGSDAGGKTAAILMSLIRSCERHDVEPLAYLRHVLTRIADMTIPQLPQLLPDQWKTTLHGAPTDPNDRTSTESHAAHIA